MAEQNPPIWMDGSTAPGAALRRLTTSLMSPGIARIGDLAVTEHLGTPNMSVDVATGSAIVAGTSSTYQGSYFVENQGTVVKTISAAHATNPRKDIVVARVRENAIDSSGVSAWDISVVTGTPAASPVAPAAPANSMLLATVDVLAAATSIVNARITSARTLARPWNSAWGEVAYAEATSSQSSISTETDLTGVTVTWTAIAGRRYELTARVPVFEATGAGTLAVMIYDGAGATRFGQGNQSIAAGGAGNFTVTGRFTGSGSVTRKVRVIATGGGGTVTSSANVPSYISIMDVGPT